MKNCISCEAEVKEIFCRYSISNVGTDLPFSVDEDSGHLRIIKWLDYENVSLYRFEVSAKVGYLPHRYDPIHGS